MTGETLYTLPPLGLPPEGSAITPESLLTCDAARLFVERARAALPAFALTPHNAPAITPYATPRCIDYSDIKLNSCAG